MPIEVGDALDATAVGSPHRATVFGDVITVEPATKRCQLGDRASGRPPGNRLEPLAAPAQQLG